MNERTIPHALLLLIALFLGGCAEPGGPSASPEGGSPLAGAAIGGPFTLIDQDGRQVSDTDFNGRYRLVYFGFSYCPDVCPVDLQLVGRGLRQLEQGDPATAEKIQPIFITVDPERDTPEVLKQYVAAFHPRLIGLTGTPEQIADVAKRYGVYHARRDQEVGSGYLVDHSRVLLLFGPQGEPVAIIPHDQGLEAFAAELRRWVT